MTWGHSEHIAFKDKQICWYILNICILENCRWNADAFVYDIHEINIAAGHRACFRSKIILKCEFHQFCSSIQQKTHLMESKVRKECLRCVPHDMSDFFFKPNYGAEFRKTTLTSFELEWNLQQTESSFDWLKLGSCYEFLINPLCTQFIEKKIYSTMYDEIGRIFPC